MKTNLKKPLALIIVVVFIIVLIKIFIAIYGLEMLLYTSVMLLFCLIVLWALNEITSWF